jgi:hypothetical protein
VLVIAITALASLTLTIAPSSGSCEGPSIAFEGKPDAEETVVSPGDTVSLVGQRWTLDCFDTGPTGACARGPGDELPMRGLDVDLVPSGEGATVRVVEGVNARPDLTLAETFTVPELERGLYRIIVRDGSEESFPDLFLTVRG